MDKFDQEIAKAKQSYEPKTNFVEDTMEQLKNQKPHRRWSMKIWLPSLAGIAVVAAIVFIAWPKTTSNNNSPSMSSQSNTSQASQSASSLTPGSDNASLDNDLNSIQGSMNQAASDQTGAENAVNDNQNQITVPTD